MWEIDALRGFLILAVLINHLTLTVDAFCINGYYDIDSFAWAEISDPLHVWYTVGENGVLSFAAWVTNLRKYCNNPAVDTFFILSGISCIFSRDNLKRGLKLLAGAFIIAAFTKLLAVWTGDPTRFIRFGVLHCYAYCHLIYSFLLEKKNDRVLLGVAAVALVVGYYLRYNPISSGFALLLPFGVYERGVSQSDYWPIFPMLGWMLIGVVLGRRFYAGEKSLLPNPIMIKWTRPLQWLGRYSGQIYLLHIFLYTAVFCGIGYVFHLF